MSAPFDVTLADTLESLFWVVVGVLFATAAVLAARGKERP